MNATTENNSVNWFGCCLFFCPESQHRRRRGANWSEVNERDREVYGHMGNEIHQLCLLLLGVGCWYIFFCAMDYDSDVDNNENVVCSDATMEYIIWILRWIATQWQIRWLKMTREAETRIHSASCTCFECFACERNVPTRCYGNQLNARQSISIYTMSYGCAPAHNERRWKCTRVSREPTDQRICAGVV